MTDQPIVITDRRIKAWTAMWPDQQDELIDLLLRHGVGAYRTQWVDYDVVDGQPVLRALLLVFDELGYPQAASDGTIVTETVTAPLVGALPSWWQPAAPKRRFRIRRTSCGCGGSWAWVEVLPSGAERMCGCVCHHSWTARLRAGQVTA